MRYLFRKSSQKNISHSASRLYIIPSLPVAAIAIESAEMDCANPLDSGAEGVNAMRSVRVRYLVEDGRLLSFVLFEAVLLISIQLPF